MEIASDTAFYIIVMLLVILLGLMIITGGNPLKLIQGQSLSESFLPGKIMIRDPEVLKDAVRLTCPVDKDHVLSVHGIKFATTEIASSEKDEVKFLITVDINNVLFVGTDQDGHDVLTCKANDEGFDCPQDVKMDFNLNKIGRLEGWHTFHFIVWKADSGVAGAARTYNLDKVLEDYTESYISSFDLTVDIDEECRRNFCNEINEESLCRANSVRGCFWSEITAPMARGVPTLSITRCLLCPAFTGCNDYNKEQCTQCTEALTNCKPGFLWGCEVK